MWKCALLKKARKSIVKNCRLIFSETVKNKKINWSPHNSMNEKCCALFRYENDRYIIEITDLQLFISPKWDGVYKKGTSCAGPRRLSTYPDVRPMDVYINCKKNCVIGTVLVWCIILCYLLLLLYVCYICY